MNAWILKRTGPDAQETTAHKSSSSAHGASQAIARKTGQTGVSG